jgi:hypothetical protein
LVRVAMQAEKTAAVHKLSLLPRHFRCQQQQAQQRGEQEQWGGGGGRSKSGCTVTGTRTCCWHV